MRKSLVWLTVGAFAVGTEGFVVAGILPAIASDLGVSVPVAGQVVTVFAITFAVGSPLLAMLTSRWERKTLLIAALGGCAAANLLACVAPSYGVLILARVLQALSAGAFMPTASAYAASVAPPGRRARALTSVSVGLTLATLIGVPVGTIVGNGLGWRMTFLAIAGLTALALAGIALALARLPGNETATLADRLAIVRRRDVIAVLTLTMLGTIGAFTVYTYLAPFLQRAAGFSGHAIAGVLLLFGLGGAIGNIAGGVACDRWGARPVITVVLVILAAAFVTLSLAAEILDGRTAAVVCCLAITAWGTFGWSFPAGQQMRLVLLAPSLSAVALSLNSSATYFGIAIGAALGGLVVANGAVTEIGWIGAVFQLLGLLVLRLWQPTPGVRGVCAGAAAKS